jgi:hypothetical protein
MRIARCWIWVAVVTLSGCGVQNLWRDETERFEEALPLPAVIVQAKAKVDALVSHDAVAREAFQREYDSRRAVRATKCLPDKPSMFDTPDDIRGKVQTACMDIADEELRAWTQGARLKLLLASPTLRPLPSETPKFIATTETPSVFGMSDASPILVVARDRKLEVLDAGTGRTVYRDTALPERPTILAPSPNGRVFAAIESSSVVLRESETGEVLANYTGYRNFVWLDATTGLLTDVNFNQRALFDGLTGTLSQPKGMSAFTGTVALVSKDPLRFVIPGFMNLASFEFTRQNGPQVRLLEQRDRLKTGASNGNLLATGDGRHVVIADARNIIVADATSLISRAVPTGLFNPLQACALEEPDAVLIKGNVRDQHFRQYYYVYDLVDDTFSPAEDDRLLPSRGGVSECPVRFGGLNAVYVKTQNGFQRLDDVKRGVRYGVGALDAHMAELFEAEEQRMQAVRARESASETGASYAARMGAPTKPALGDLATGASIQAVGVYQAENSSRGAGPDAQRWPGPITVFVRPADRPIVLVLSSYEAVTWHLNVMPGARLKAILLGGYHASTVTGAGETRIVSIRPYAYEANSAGYDALDKEVMRQTGQRIGEFQGRYGGKTFMVGGR